MLLRMENIKSHSPILKLLKSLFYERKNDAKNYKLFGITIFKIIKINNYRTFYLLGIPVIHTRRNKFAKYNDFIEYSKWLDDVKNNRTLFVPQTSKPYTPKNNDVKIFAYYLSQFHAIPENDDAHGKGFTEWSNVASSTPAFVNHYQPQIPYDLGFYNLLMPGVMERQVELAKMYGIYGFCFYYYWFDGKKVLEKPLEYFLNSKIDFHFHFFWANETWTSRWQGGNKEIILKQQYNEKNFEQFFYDILPYIKDDRYEKIDNKPILMVYHPKKMGKELFCKFSDVLQTLAKKHGFNGMYLTTIYDFKKNKKFLDEYQLDGLVEFYPAGLKSNLKTQKITTISRKMNVTCYRLHDFIKDKKHLFNTDFDLFKCSFPNWDNSPRKIYSCADIYLLDDSDFKIWLSDNIKWTKQNNSQNKQYVYINAWNEWGEGAVLEPTTRYGYKSLQIVKDVLESF